MQSIPEDVKALRHRGYYVIDTATFKNDPAKIQNRDDVITHLSHPTLVLMW